MTQTVHPSEAEDPRLASRDLRAWLRLADGMGRLRQIDGADWDLEIGALTEMLTLDEDCRACLLFDHIPGYPPGWRLATNVFPTQELAAIALGLPPHLSPTECVQAWREQGKRIQPLPAHVVADGPVFEHVLRGDDVDLYRFPAPRWHTGDGGRYLGTGNVVVTRDPETGWINVGTYRMMLHDRDKLGLYISPGHHGRLHRDQYFAAGQPMPVVAAFGTDPTLFAAGGMGLPLGANEYEWVGGIRGEPVEVIAGPVTGLPLPAHAEIVVEGFVHPDRRLDEGPFGEWTGYYASAARPEPYLQVEAIYHRADPIILGYAPTRPPAQDHRVRSIVLHAAVWDALEAAGIPDVRAVTRLPAASAGMLVIAIRQRYGGHAKQAALVASQCRGGAYLGRYIVVVDDDVDVDNQDEVLWAIWTRSEPAESLDVIHNCWSSPLDPRIPPHKRAAGDFTNSRLVIDATRPFHWRDQFPAVSGVSPALRASLREKWASRLFEPR
jgi:4-hydroxy-3-polyprenylbenzoate decarboxylase